MTALDWTLAALLGVSVLIGLWRGLVRTLIGLVGWAGGGVLALRHGARVGEYAQFLPEGMRYPAGMITIMVASVIFAAIVGMMMAALLKSVGLRPGDRLLGAVFGLARGLAIAALMALAGDVSGLSRRPEWQSALCAPMLSILAEQARSLMPVSSMISRSPPRTS
jgi:membrane protein required for colicin V production